MQVKYLGKVQVTKDLNEVPADFGQFPELLMIANLSDSFVLWTFIVAKVLGAL